MPRNKPQRQKKQYPLEFVMRIRDLYQVENMSRIEVARAMGVSESVITRVMERYRIRPRRQVPRDQKGEKNASWKGSAAKYNALHARVRAARGTPSRCEDCGTTTAKRYEWASITKNYEDIYDYKRLCSSCHHIFDDIARNLHGSRATTEEPE